MASERLTLVVPCYNEADRLDQDAFVAFARRHSSARILLVDDGSTDATPTVLQELSHTCPERLRTLPLDVNRGKGEAVRQGMLTALEEDPDFVGYWDADLATPLQAVPDFLEAFAEDPRRVIVLGSRVRLIGRDIQRSAIRHYTGRVFATFVSQTLRLAVYDTQCGAKVFRVTEEVRELFRQPFHSRWIFDVELLARWLTMDHADELSADEAIYELPLRRWADVAGSKLRVSDYLRAIFELARIRRLYFTGRSADASSVGPS